jgi:hypothetical protein
MLYSAWVSIIYALNGTAPFDRVGISPDDAIGLYLGGGAVCGAVVGLLWPLAKSRAGAYLTATIAAAFGALGLGCAMEGMPQHWGPDVWTGLSVMAICAGVGFGGSLWRAASNR